MPRSRSLGGDSGGSGGASMGVATSRFVGGGGRGSSLMRTSPSGIGGGGGGGRSGVDERDAALVGGNRWAAWVEEGCGRVAGDLESLGEGGVASAGCCGGQAGAGGDLGGSGAGGFL